MTGEDPGMEEDAILNARSSEFVSPVLRRASPAICRDGGVICNTPLSRVI
jgi:hypothetical protein